MMMMMMISFTVFQNVLDFRSLFAFLRVKVPSEMLSYYHKILTPHILVVSHLTHVGALYRQLKVLPFHISYVA